MGIMEKKMETGFVGFMDYRGYNGDNGKENGSYYLQAYSLVQSFSCNQ